METVLTDTLIEKADAFIEAHREEILQTLTELVKVPSVQAVAEPGAPFGRECAALLEKAMAYYEEITGLTAKIQREDGYLTAEYGAGDKTIGIFTHGDVVPAGDGWTVTEPFSPLIRDDFMFGRGCHDNKSGLVQMLYAVKMIKEMGITLKNKLLLFTGINEESGMADVMAFGKNEKMPDTSIVPDGSYPFYSGEKGRATFMLRKEGALQDILSVSGGDCYNKVLDEAVAVLAVSDALKTELSQKIEKNESFTLSEKDGTLILSAKGLTAHAAFPQEGINAAYLLSTLLADCASLSETDRNTMCEAAVILKTHFGEGIGIDGEDAVFGRLTCVNGMVRTEESALSLSFDVRYGLQITGDEIRKKAETAKEGWQAMEFEDSDGYNIENTHPVAKALGRAYTFVSGEAAEGKKMAAGTYARHLENAFSVGTIAEYKGMPEMPAGHGGVHQPDEVISVEGFLEGLKILFCMILEVDSIL